MITGASADPQYSHMNGGAHRRPAPRIAAPAITWQRSFWKPSSAKLGSAEEVEEADAAWHGAIDRLLLSLFRYFNDLQRKATRSQFACANWDDNLNTLYLFRSKAVFDSNLTRPSVSALEPEERSVRHDIFNLHFRFSSARVTISARLHLEYFTLLVAADFSVARQEGVADPELSEARTTLERLHDLTIARHDEARTASGSSKESMVTVPRLDAGTPDSQLASARGAIVYGFQRWVEEQIKRAQDKYAPDAGDIGGVFGDFFGVIFSLKLDTDTEHLSEATQPEPPPGHALRIPAQVQGNKLEGPDALRIIDALWPSLRNLDGGGIDAPAQADGASLGEAANNKPEYTISLLQKGATIYATTLGKLARGRRPGDWQEPVFYCLVVSYPSKWRLGRLIDRLHVLGTLRLAALRDLNAINVASMNINQLNRDIERALTASGGQLSPERLDGLQNSFARIGSGVPGGLSYRIARSRYYVSNYKEQVDSLGAAPIDGFQYYNSFVRRKIYDAYNYIDRVGLRYGDVRKQLTFVAQSSADRATQKLHEATTEQTKAMRDLLQTAEYFAAVPIAYYTASFLDHAFGAIGEALHWKSPHSPIATLIAYGLGISLALGLMAIRGSGMFKRRSQE